MLQNDTENELSKQHVICINNNGSIIQSIKFFDTYFFFGCCMKKQQQCQWLKKGDFLHKTDQGLGTPKRTTFISKFKKCSPA